MLLVLFVGQHACPEAPCSLAPPTASTSAAPAAPQLGQAGPLGSANTQQSRAAGWHVVKAGHVHQTAQPTLTKWQAQRASKHPVREMLKQHPTTVGCTLCTALLHPAHRLSAPLPGQQPNTPELTLFPTHGPLQRCCLAPELTERWEGAAYSKPVSLTLPCPMGKSSRLSSCSSSCCRFCLARLMRWWYSRSSIRGTSTFKLGGAPAPAAGREEVQGRAGRDNRHHHARGRRQLNPGRQHSWTLRALGKHRAGLHKSLQCSVCNCRLRQMLQRTWTLIEHCQAAAAEKKECDRQT